MAPTPDFVQLVHQQHLIHSDVPGTFSNDSYIDRLPGLVRDVVKRNAHRLTPEQQQRLLQLADDLVHDTKIPLPDQVPGTKGATTQHWVDVLTGHDYTWQHSPWFMSEQYMFHVMLILSGYFDAGVDPFHATKLAELAESTPWNLLQSAVTVSSLPESEKTRDGHLKRLIKLCLWGNKADGCYTKVKDTISGVDATLAVEDKYLLVDHSDDVVQFLEDIRTSKETKDICVQWVNDNCGTELLLDLALADHLLSHEWCGSVVLNVKAEPMYISDACPSDVLEHIAAMTVSERTPEVQALGARLTKYVDDKKLQITSDPFWNTSKFYWELPAELEARLKAEATLVIFKGDLNYRRLLGDRLWPATTPLTTAVPYFPTPFVSFRTLKSDPIVGVSAEQEKELDQEDPEWRFNGKRGTIMGVLRK
ncbi:hypothetical protein Poli38472_003790 [Pythium oligandrum]|uniref:Sugar phosphate phosphatase n=1 Tax=Pythium oligandrum TaxID=41045 RepID=A0A8K1CMH6_PYTOL|nr:hypothetical protein Poli38472_003790 [Pythium oligandrum]|eukprot:TMW66025.1 hypothetical protein Poli38472_003790 [Pythium oligandrum]